MVADNRPIFLVGFSGVGKSKVGAYLAKILGRGFEDTDLYVEKRYHDSIAGMFATCGVEKFRKREHAAIIELCQKQNYVVATGGGLPCYEDNMDIMLSKGIVVYLQCPIPILSERLYICRATRPLVASKNQQEIAEYIRRTLPDREQYYNRATLTVEVGVLYTVEDEQKIAQKIADRLADR